MFKLLILTKRKAGMSLQEFREYYEKRHAVLVQRITPLMRGYRRNYLTPVLGASAGEAEPPYDCVAEAWFDTEEDFRLTLDSLVCDPHKTAVLAEDEAKLFDRSTIRWCTATESHNNRGYG
jgi:uncharacterized protein (TIGR02118 family)